MSQKLGNMYYVGDRYRDLSSETRAAVETEVQKVIEDSYIYVRGLLSSKRKELDLLARALLEYETLDLGEVEKVIRGESLENRVPMPKGSNLVISVPVSDTPPFTPPLSPGPDSPEQTPPAPPPPPPA